MGKRTHSFMQVDGSTDMRAITRFMQQEGMNNVQDLETLRNAVNAARHLKKTAYISRAYEPDGTPVVIVQGYSGKQKSSPAIESAAWTMGFKEVNHQNDGLFLRFIQFLAHVAGIGVRAEREPSEDDPF